MMSTAKFYAVRELGDRMRSLGYGVWLIGETAAAAHFVIEPTCWLVATDADEDACRGLSIPAHVRLVHIPDSGDDDALQRFAASQLLALDSLLADLEGRIVVDPHGAIESLNRGELKLAQRSQFSAIVRREPGQLLRIIRLAISLRGAAARKAQHLFIARAVLEEVRVRAPELELPEAPLERTARAEAIRTELEAIFTSPDRAAIIGELCRQQLLGHLLPDLQKLQYIRPSEQYHGERFVLEHVLSALDSLPPDASLEVVLGVLMHDIGKAHTRRVYGGRDAPKRIGFPNHEFVGAARAKVLLERFRFPSSVVEQVVAATWVHMFLRREDADGLEAPLRWALLSLPDEHFEVAMQVHSADVAGRLPGERPARDLSAHFREARKEFLASGEQKCPLLPHEINDAGVTVTTRNAIYVYQALKEAMLSGHSSNRFPPDHTSNREQSVAVA